jgi:hypothetical protein
VKGPGTVFTAAPGDEDSFGGRSHLDDVTAQRI